MPALIERLAETLADRDGESPDRVEHAAAEYGRDLLLRGSSIEDVVRGCTALRASPELNYLPDIGDRIDAAIACAVAAYCHQHAVTVAAESKAASDARLGALASEMRNLVNTSLLAISAMKRGSVGLSGATGAALDRSLAALRGLVDRSLAEVRQQAGAPRHDELIEIGPFIAAAHVVAAAEAANRGCDLTVAAEPDIYVEADRHILDGALGNLMHGVLNTVRPDGHLFLSARSGDGRVTIEVEDSGANVDDAELREILSRFERRTDAHTVLGSALLCSVQAVESVGGTLSARAVAGRGCLYTIELPVATV